MTRQDLRNHALKVLGVLVFLALLWETLPQECKTTKTEVPRYCVD